MSDKIQIDLSGLFNEEVAPTSNASTEVDDGIKIDLTGLFSKEGDFKNNVANADQQYTGPHMSQEEYLQIASEDFGFFGDGREEIMSDRLYEIYNPNRDEDGIQFEEFGAGNNVRVVLPNGDKEEFTLGGGGTFFADETAKMKTDHHALKEFIGQKKSKQLSPETISKFEDVLLDRDEAQLMSLDNNIARDLNLLGLKGEDADGNVSDYKFEAVSNLLFDGTINAVRVTTPKGTKKTINVGGLGFGYHDEDKKREIMNYITRFIESDPTSFSETDEYNDDLKNIEEIIDPFITEEFLLSNYGSDIFNPAVKNNLKKKIKKELGTLSGNFLGMATGDRPEASEELVEEGKVKKFKNLTREQQNALIDQKIEEYVEKKTAKDTNLFGAKELKDQISLGLDIETIDNNIFGKDGSIYSRYTNDYDRTINLWQMKLDEATTEVEKKEALNNINAQKLLKQEAGLGNKSAFVDMNPDSPTFGEYTYSDSENAGEMVFNITNEDVTLDNGITAKSINSQITKVKKLMEDGKLTREELKEEARIVNLAVMEWEDKHNTETHPIFVSSRDPLKSGNILYKTDAWIKANPDMWQEFGYTDPEAAEAVSNYLSRTQQGINLKGKRAVYDRVYGLNETVLSQETQGWSVLGESFIKSVSTHEQNVERQADVGLIGEEWRQTYNEELQNLGVTLTAEEKEHAKAGFGEATGEAFGGLPKMIFDFWLANKALGAVGVNRLLTTATSNLKKTRTTIKLADGTTKPMTRGQLVKHIKNVQSQKKGAPYSFSGAKTVQKEQKIIDKWMKMKQPGATDAPAHIVNRATSLLLNSLYEGVKMDLAMQMPSITGMGYDPETAPEIGSSFATGFGFGFMGGIIPWNSMYKSVMGTPARVTTAAKPGLFGMEAAYKGVKVPFTNKEVAFKGMYDYLVAAPVNFLAGSQFGSFTNQIADHMMHDKDWNEWLDENYEDWGGFLKHAATELLMGVAMRAHKFNRLDFTTEGKMIQLRQKANLEIFGDKKAGKKGLMEEKNVVDDNGKTVYEYRLEEGKMVKRPVKKWVLRKGKTALDLEPYQTIVNHATVRLNEMQDMKQYLDPITGPLKLMRDFKSLMDNSGMKNELSFVYDYSGKGFNMKFIEPGKRFYNPEKDAGKHSDNWTGKINESKKTKYQGVINPEYINPHHIPHELLHVGMHKLMSEDVMFKGKYIDGLIDLAKEMKTPDGISLYDVLVENGVLKEGRDFDHKQVKEWELFSYVGEFFRQEGNQEMLEGKYGFDKLASFTHKQLSEKFGMEPDQLNTRKDLVQFYTNYAKTIGEGRGFRGNFKHLEKFVSPTKTKRQQARREAWDKENGRGPTSEMKSTDLKRRIDDLIETRKVHPAFIQYKEDKDVDKFKDNPGIKKINSEIKRLEKVLENLPEDAVFGKESAVERAINDLARIGNRMMTNAEWKKDGLWEAFKELEKVGGKFDNLLTKGMNFDKGATVNGYNMSEWLQRVKWGIEGKTSTPEKPTYIDKGIIGTLERYKPETDLGGKESLSAWINKQYAKRQTAVKKWMMNNPKPVSMETKAGEGRTLGDRLLAPEDVAFKAFQEQDLSFGKTKQDALEWIDIVQIEGKRLKNELPIETKEFEKKGGWKETILNSVPKIETMKDASPKDIMEIGIDFTHEMMGVKLSESQKTKPNDLGKDNLINFQKWIDMEWKAPETRVGVDKKTGEIKPKQQKVDDTGGDVFKTIKNVETVKTVLNKDATIKFDKGVSEKLKGTSSLKKLGTLSELFHKATTKDYTAKELKEMGYEINPKPNTDGSWRVATGPGGAIWLPGKSKGKPITSNDIKEFLGKKKDGSWTELSADRSLAGKSRRIMEIVNGSLVEQTLRDADVLDANIAWNLKSSKSQGLWSKYLGRESFENKMKFLEEVRSSGFYQEFYRNVDEEIKKGKEGSIEKGMAKALVNHFTKVRATKDSKFDMSNQTLKKIAKDIYHEFKFSKRISPEIISRKAVKAVKLPNDMSAIEAKWKSKGENVEIFEGPGEFFDWKKGDISDGYTQMFEYAKKVDAKYGLGYFETYYLSGAAEGGGIGKYSNIKNMLNNITKTLRYSILRGANTGFAEGKGKAAEEGMVEYDGYAMLDAVHKAIAKEKGVSVKKLRKYTEQSKDKSREVGIKKEVMKALKMLKGETFDSGQIERLFTQGENNKTALRQGVEDLMVGYKNGDISQRVVRQWIEMHAGNMFGLIKASGSLAALPKNMKDLIAEFGTNPEDWVLEHITPAKYVKARIYDYILSKGDTAMKEAMELTIRDHHTTLIPKKYDTAVNKTLQEDLPSAHLPGMDPLYARYYGANHPIDFNIGFTVHHGYRKGMVYDYHANLSHAELQKSGKEVGESIRKLFPKILSKGSAGNLNSKNLNHLKNIDKAIANGRKFDQKRKGMSTWDFDDTLATTKSGVRATIPNPSGKPKPSRKAVFLAGGAGSGKSNVVKKLGLEKDGFKIVNQDISLEWLKKNNGLPENMNDLTKEQRSILGKLGHQARTIAKNKMMKYQGNAEGVVIDGTGGSAKAMEKLVNEFKDKGYDVSMLFVETSLKTALERNRARKERSLLDKIVEKNHEAVQGNKKGFKTMFGERFMEVKTDKLKQEDAMPKDLVDKMNDFVRGYEKIRLDAEEFATQGKDILDQGGKFDFGEFNVVTKGEKGPFFQKALERAKKFGNEHQYVLTARPPEAQIPIYEFLKSQGLDIPLKNITGLGNSTGEAKALWMLEKFAEGYNDMYFADDALQNVKAVKDALGQVDARSKVVQAKVQKEIDLNNIKDVNRLDSPDLYNKILNSKNLRNEYEKTISKRRPDLVKEGLVSQTVDEMFKFVDSLDVPVNKRKKYQRITTKWLATSNIKLKEDGYKIKEAIDIAERYKEDIFSYKNPNELIEKYAGKSKAKPTDPKTVKEFAKGTVTNGKHGITEHVVAETKEGQEAVRKVMDTHFGEKSNPWCLAQKKGGKLTEESWEAWTRYSDGPKSMVFQNGKLVAFKANGQYWDRMDNPTDAPVVNIKEGRVTKKVELVPIGGGKVQEFVMETRTVSKDKKTVTTEILQETDSGYESGTKIVENRVNGVTIKKTRSTPDRTSIEWGFEPGSIKEIQNYNKKGEITSSIFYESAGVIGNINYAGEAFRNMKESKIVETKGDIISHEGGGEYFAKSLVRGKIAEIGFELGRGVKLESVIKTSPEGKIRLDLEKVAKANPDARAMIEGVRPTTLAEMFKPAKPVVKEGMRALEPVREVLNQLDFKSDVQQDRSLWSKNLSKDINDIMERSLDIESDKKFSAAEAKMRGKDIKRRRLIMPDTAADLELLIEPLHGKGKQGIENKEWFEKNFYKPWEKGVNDMNTAVQTSFNDYATLRKQNKKVVKSLQEPIEGTTFTNDMAARVYIYNKAGFKIPGLAKGTEAKLVEHIRNNPELRSYAENVSRLTGIETGLSKPKESWWAETLATEIQDIGQGASRKRFLQNWIDIKNEVFSPENLNKMESKLGTRWRETIEDMFDRMETGRTRSMKLGTGGAEVMNYLNGSVGTIMNFNTRSATLQLISSVNFINHAENNPLAASKAFLNQKQYWNDFMTILNSDMLVQRRAGLKINVTEQELASAAAKSQNKARAAIAWILKQGYIPTKMADSFAIASGGATYYRNRIRMYEKQGLSTKEAEKKAWIDFQAIAEKTQQSSRPDLLSQQQTSFVGRLILPFANTPMQMNRIMVKETLDVAKGRYDGYFGENSLTHKLSKITYYGAVQSLIFAGLQSALFATMGFDPDSEAIDDKKARTVNTVLDSFLRGMGWQTAIIAGVKNAILEAVKQDKKGFTADYSEVTEKLLNISPTIGSKYSKLDAMGNTYKYNRKEIKEKGFSLDNTPLLEMAAQGTEAVFNIPVHGMMRNVDNIEGALNEQHEAWQRVLMTLGWSKWDVGVSDYQKEKKEKKNSNKKKNKVRRSW